MTLRRLFRSVGVWQGDIPARRLLPDEKNLVVLAGYQAPGTRGRALLDGARTLRIHGQGIPVRAEFIEVHGLSSHADQDDLMRWLQSGASLLRHVFVTHGEPAASAALAERTSAS